MKVRLSRKGRVVIPAALRRKYHLTPGAKLQLVDHGGVLEIILAGKNPITGGAGMLKGSGSLTGVIVEENCMERERGK